VIERWGEGCEGELCRQVLRALAGKGTALFDLGRREEADVVIEAFVRLDPSEDDELALARAHAAVAGAWVRVLSKRGRHEQAVAVADGLLERFAEQPPGLPVLVVSAMRSKASALSAALRREEALRLLAAITEDYARAEEPSVRRVVAIAMNDQAGLLDESGQDEGAIELQDELVGRFGDSEDPGLRGPVANALLGKLAILERAGRNEQALGVLDDITQRFDGEPPPGRPDAAPNAGLRKAGLLKRMGRRREAIAVCDELAARYGAGTDLAACVRVASALGR
jgi:tetratricopeptide (TPR) repeat protein